MKRYIQVTFSIDDGDFAGRTEAQWRETEGRKAIFATFEQAMIRGCSSLFHVYAPRSFRCDYTVRDGNGVMIVSGVIVKRKDNPILQLQSDMAKSEVTNPQWGQGDRDPDNLDPDVNPDTGDERETMS